MFQRTMKVFILYNKYIIQFRIEMDVSKKIDGTNNSSAQYAIIDIIKRKRCSESPLFVNNEHYS